MTVSLNAGCEFGGGSPSALPVGLHLAPCRTETPVLLLEYTVGIVQLLRLAVPNTELFTASIDTAALGNGRVTGGGNFTPGLERRIEHIE